MRFVRDGESETSDDLGCNSAVKIQRKPNERPLPWPSESLSPAQSSQVARQVPRIRKRRGKSGRSHSWEAFLSSLPQSESLRSASRTTSHRATVLAFLANESPSLAEYHSRFPNDPGPVEAAFRAAPDCCRTSSDSAGTTFERAARHESEGCQLAGDSWLSDSRALRLRAGWVSSIELVRSTPTASSPSK